MATADVLEQADVLGPPPNQVNLQADFDKAKSAPPPFDPVALKEKYIAERDKRLQHGGGINQYRLIEEQGQFSGYLKDPWSEPIERDPVTEVNDVVIIGGGYGAQLVAVRLIEAGVSNIRLVEKAGDYGGTWYWNRYPGAQCDIESYIYMPLLEELGYMPTEKYARAKELLKHSEMIGRRYGLTRQLGPLHRPKLPGVRGIEDYKGHSFHSSRWDYNYTGGDNSGDLHKLSEKRVAVIGTGATAVQIVPNVAKYAKELYVFQRTPSSVDARGNRPTDPEWAASLKPGWQKERMENFNLIVNGGIVEQDYVQDGWTDILHKLLARRAADITDPEKAAAERQLADFEKMNEVRARADSVVMNKETAEGLKPWYNQLCKRPCFHDEYLQSFNQNNVHLVDTKGKGIERITEKGIVANGEEFGIDCIIYATGFELATDWSHRSNMEIYGRDGQTITDCWSTGASTLHGWTTRGFPNCFFVSIVQAALTPNFVHVTGEQATHLAYIVSQAIKKNVRSVEPTREAEDTWVQTIEKLAVLRASFLKECTPGYYNNEGTPSKTALRNASYGGGSPAFLKILEDWRADGKMEGLDLKYF
ncbi:hypothetical protein BST61_g8032 [Cercospora zeina]